MDSVGMFYYINDFCLHFYNKIYKNIQKLFESVLGLLQSIGYFRNQLENIQFTCYPKSELHYIRHKHKTNHMIQFI